MATITATDISGGGASTNTVTTLDGSSDTFTYTPGAILILRNPTGSGISPIISGDGATVVGVTGVGDVDVSTGFDGLGTIAASSEATVPLDSIRRYLTGTITISSGSGLEAVLLAP